LFGGLAITAAGLVWFAATNGIDIDLDSGGFDLRTSATDGGAEPPTGQREQVAPAARNVTPEGVTSGPVVSGPLLRAAPEPAGEPGRPLTTFRRVVVIDATRFRTIRDRTPVVVRLAGVTGPAFSETCTDRDGKVWKCGARARAELSRLIRNRSVACVVTDDTDPAELVASCRIGVRDISEWLAMTGWADATDDAPAIIRDLADEARGAGRGRFGPAPRGVIAG
jgi:endonuclease YncB( thermonuclease family)